MAEPGRVQVAESELAGGEDGDQDEAESKTDQVQRVGIVQERNSEKADCKDPIPRWARHPTVGDAGGESPGGPRGLVEQLAHRAVLVNAPDRLRDERRDADDLNLAVRMAPGDR